MMTAHSGESREAAELRKIQKQQVYLRNVLLGLKFMLFLDRTHNKERSTSQSISLPAASTLSVTDY